MRGVGNHDTETQGKACYLQGAVGQEMGWQEKLMSAMHDKLRFEYYAMESGYVTPGREGAGSAQASSSSKA